MKIHIMGASCAGSTTLGKALAAFWNCPYVDTDDYFWLPSEIPFTLRRTFEARNRLLKGDLQGHQNVIVGGSLINWGAHWKTFFDLVVFLYVPPDIRMQRVKDRELGRFGSALTEHPMRAEQYQKFLTWAAGYDLNLQGRSLTRHKEWLRHLPCETLEITGDTSLAQRIARVAKKVKGLQGK